MLPQFALEAGEAALDVALIPPDRRAGGDVAAERLRPVQLRVEGEQPAIGVTEQRLLLGIDSIARGDQRLEFAFQKVQESLGAAGWRRFAPGQALAVLGVRRVVLGARLEVIKHGARITHADHQHAAAQHRVGTRFQRPGLQRQRRKQRIAVEHVEHWKATGWRRLRRPGEEDLVVASGVARMQHALLGLRQRHGLPGGRRWRSRLGRHAQQRERGQGEALHA